MGFDNPASVDFNSLICFAGKFQPCQDGLEFLFNVVACFDDKCLEFMPVAETAVYYRLGIAWSFLFRMKNQNYNSAKCHIILSFHCFAICVVGRVAHFAGAGECRRELTASEKYASFVVSAAVGTVGKNRLSSGFQPLFCTRKPLKFCCGQSRMMD